MNTWEIKQKQSPPPVKSFSEQLVTSEDVRQAESGVVKTSSGVKWSVGIGIFFIIFRVTLSGGDKFIHDLGLKGEFVLPGMLFLCIGCPFLITWLGSRFLDSYNYKQLLKRIVMGRLRNEHSATINREKYTVSKTSADLRSLYEEQSKNLELLHSLIDQADNSLERAKQLFSKRAFNPFWDSIEDVVNRLGEFRMVSANVHKAAKNYYQALDNLEGRKHNFPPFPVKSSDIPDPTEQLEKLSELNDEAQRDFQFAQIVTQRATTSAIITGFRNMHDAISGLHDAVINCFSDLNETINSGLREISSEHRDSFNQLAESNRAVTSELRGSLESQAKAKNVRDSKHQEFVENTLDNIQARRKPRLSELKNPHRLK